ncbi:hypothetical protein [Rhizobium sp. BK376]|uniref:hypothetical protein n=1 Tax=Rhizobium sp. BK376 TaxID=2512149 RepID=UPI0010E9C1E9|nr:hypothetical protein [Rhizobium sp. BK376]TCR72655.1 hypothetical protein EV561_12824 [Rhizobium sp. BK376]
MVEIARALTTNARIIVMDEPTTSPTSRETDRLFEVIAGLKAQGAIIYINHRMEEIYQLADRVSVLRDSSYVGTLDRQDLSASKLVSMMVGRGLSSVLSNGLILVGVSDIWQYIIKGLVIIVAVTLDRYRLKGLSRT